MKEYLKRRHITSNEGIQNNEYVQQWYTSILNIFLHNKRTSKCLKGNVAE